MLEEILAILYRPLTIRLEAVMATTEELTAKVDALRTSLEDAKARITADVDELRRLLAERVDPATLDAVAGALDQLTADVQTIDPDPNFPADAS